MPRSKTSSSSRSSIRGTSTPLAKFAEDAPDQTQVETGTAVPSPAGLAFIYTGNGSVWEGMGRRLMAEEPVFSDAVLRVDEIFWHWSGWSLLDELAGKNGSGRYDYTEIAQPALFALQVGVTEMLRRRGVVGIDPDELIRRQSSRSDDFAVHRYGNIK